MKLNPEKRELFLIISFPKIYLFLFKISFSYLYLPQFEKDFQNLQFFASNH